jgi:phosphoglycerate dehydrogenase-like enzyme
MLNLKSRRRDRCRKTELTKPEELLKALNSPRLFGAAIDVTDPEPLPPSHALWSHPKIIITPHLSGDTEGQYDIATDILLENIRRLEASEELINLIDLGKGY